MVCNHVPSLTWLRAQSDRAWWTRRESNSYRRRARAASSRLDDGPRSATDGNRTRLKVIDSHRTSPDVPGSIQQLGGPHGDSNPDLTRCKRGVFPLDHEPRQRPRRESNPPGSDRQSPDVTRHNRRHADSCGPHGDLNPDRTRSQRGIFPLDHGPVTQMEGEVGLEPTTSTVQSGVFYQLNYSPTVRASTGARNRT